MQKILVRKREYSKNGATYEYRFEIASIGGQRRWIRKGGFESKKTARKIHLEDYDSKRSKVIYRNKAGNFMAVQI